VTANGASGESQRPMAVAGHYNFGPRIAGYRPVLRIQKPGAGVEYACVFMSLESTPEIPDESLPPGQEEAGRPTLQQRVVALLEVLICSDYPTQAALGSTFVAFGYLPSTANGQLSVGFVVALSLLDTLLLLSLILFFLFAHGERPRDVFLGPRLVAHEAWYGLPLVVIALGVAIGMLAAIQQFAPSLHTVAHNPLQDLIRRPRDTWLFAFVVVVAGGIREELQRAFLLHRFDRWLGGGLVGLVLTSVAFGAGHQVQGADAALTTGILGAFWGLVYLRRRSAVAPMVSHSGFNLLQIAQFLMLGR
jgi:membrane protease YdiL (CAAX protease family)